MCTRRSLHRMNTPSPGQRSANTELGFIEGYAVLWFHCPSLDYVSANGEGSEGFDGVTTSRRHVSGRREALHLTPTTSILHTNSAHIGTDSLPSR